MRELYNIGRREGEGERSVKSADVIVNCANFIIRSSPEKIRHNIDPFNNDVIHGKALKSVSFVLNNSPR